jgi:hypothetical protein
MRLGNPRKISEMTAEQLSNEIYFIEKLLRPTNREFYYNNRLLLLKEKLAERILLGDDSADRYIHRW